MGEGGILQFTLGLATNDFLKNIHLAGGELLSLAGVAEGVRYGMEKMWSTIEQGAQLEQLANRIGTTASEVYNLEMGFRGVGLAAEAVPGFIQRLQQSLSGVNEMGERTAEYFGLIGLNIQNLRSEGFQQQIQDIAAKLALLNRGDAVSLAAKLFGRFGAADILQITRGLEGYLHVMNETRNDASLFGSMAKSWDEIEQDAQIFESHMHGVWAAITTGITPELHKVITEVNDFVGKLGPALAEAFAGGGAGTLLADALMAGLEQAEYFGTRIFIALATGFGDAVYTALKVALTEFIPAWINGMKNAAKMALILMDQDQAQGKLARAQKEGNSAGAAEAQADIARDAQALSQLMGENSAQFNQHMTAAMGQVGDAMTGGVADMINSWKATADPNAPHAMLDKFNSDLDNFSKAWLKNHPPDTGTGNKDKALAPIGNYKPEFTSLEKMGFVMGGVNNPMKRSEDLLERIVFNTSVQNQFQSVQGAFQSVQGAFQNGV